MLAMSYPGIGILEHYCYPISDLFGGTQKTAENHIIPLYFDIRVRNCEPCVQCIPYVNFKNVGLLSKVSCKLTVSAIVKCKYILLADPTVLRTVL